MRVGSLVELVNDSWDLNDMCEGEIYPVKGKVYTIREFDHDCLLLEEIINPLYEYIEGFGEPAWLTIRFREIQPPMTISIESIIESELVNK